jgi:hypothetical protein
MRFSPLQIYINFDFSPKTREDMTKHKKVVWGGDISATSWIPVNRFLYLTFARFRQPQTLQTSAQKRDAEFSSKNQVSVSLVMLKSK